MLKSRVLTGALVTGAFVVASMFAAAPASAAPLPPGQQITVLDSENGQFYYANNDTAAQTAVGTGNSGELEGDYLTGIDVDDTGLGYAVGTYYGDGGPSGAYLYSADANTGVLDYIAGIQFFFDDVPESMDECTAIDYTDGNLLLACIHYDDDGTDSDRDRAYIGTWDFDAGWAIPLIELTGDPLIDEENEQFPNEPPNTFDYRYISAIAVDPISGLIYVFTIELGNNGVYTASVDAGLTPVTDTNEYQVLGADFDRGGQLWASVYRTEPPSLIPSGYAGLATVNLVDGSIPFGEPWADQQQFMDPLTVWGGLPATGPADSTAAVVGGAALLLIGAILAVGATARRRATES